MDNMKLKLIVKAIKIKMQRDASLTLENILATYKNLSDEERNEIKENFKE